MSRATSQRHETGVARIESLEERRLLSHGPISPHVKVNAKYAPVQAVHVKVAKAPKAPKVSAGVTATIDTAGVVHAEGTPGDDVITIQLDAADPSKLDIIINGTRSQFPVSIMTGIAADGGPSSLPSK